MQEKKKRNRILMLLIVGMLLIYAFTDIENVKMCIRDREKDFINTQSKKYDRQDMFPDGFDVWKVIW